MEPWNDGGTDRVAGGLAVAMYFHCNFGIGSSCHWNGHQDLTDPDDRSGCTLDIDREYDPEERDHRRYTTIRDRRNIIMYNGMDVRILLSRSTIGLEHKEPKLCFAPPGLVLLPCDRP